MSTSRTPLAPRSRERAQNPDQATRFVFLDSSGYTALINPYAISLKHLRCPRKCLVAASGPRYAF